MAVLITGGTGLIGSEVVRKLVEQKKQVIIYDLYPNIGKIKDVVEKVTVVPGDILDLAQLLTTIKKYHVDRLLHLAVLFQSTNNPTKTISVNCIGTQNIFDAARILNLSRVVYTSSMAIYGTVRKESPLNEDDLPCPQSPYAVCKVVNDVMSKVYAVRFGIDIVGIRPTIAFGTSRYTGSAGIFNHLLRESALERPIEIPENWGAKGKINPLYVKDLATCFLLATYAKHPKYRIYNAGSKKTYTMSEIAEIVKTFSPAAIITFKRENPLPQYDRPAIDSTRIRDDLGFKEDYTLEEAIQEVMNFHRRKDGIPLL